MKLRFDARYLAIAAGVAVLAAFVTIVAGTRGPAAGPVATDMSLPVLAGDGTTGRLSGMRGVVNFWASWCVACREEHPLLLRMDDQGLPVYGVNHRDDRDDAKRWLDFYGDPYRYSLYDGDGALGEALGIEALPVTLVVGSDGKVVFTHLGPLDQGIIDAEILPLLASGGPK